MKILIYLFGRACLALLNKTRIIALIVFYPITAWRYMRLCKKLDMSDKVVEFETYAMVGWTCLCLFLLILLEGLMFRGPTHIKTVLCLFVFVYTFIYVWLMQRCQLTIMKMHDKGIFLDHFEIRNRLKQTVH